MPAEQEMTPDYLDQLERYYGVRSDNDSHNLMLLLDRVRELEAELLAAQERANQFRIEADCLLRDVDGLELQLGLAQEALEQIAQGRPNKTFDPWAREVARAALAASPSEKPGSPAICRHGLFDWMCKVCRAEESDAKDAEGAKP